MSAKTKLPVRLPLDETELMSRFMDDHGDDPQEWPEPVRLAYAAKVAALRVQQLNAKKGAR